MTQQKTTDSTSAHNGADVSLIEETDDLVDAFRVAAERGDYCFFAADAEGLVEDYRKGNGGIAFRYAGSDIGGRAKEHGFIVVALPHGSPAGSLSPSRNRKAADDGNNGHEPLVFPHTVEVVEGVEEFIPSTIRLECFDREAIGFAQPLFAFCAVDTARHVVKAVDGTEYGEMGVAVRYYAVATRQGRCNKVESAANGIDDNASFDIEAEVGRPRPADYYKILSSVRIRLDNGGIWACPLPSCEALLKDWDLVFGPIH